MEHLERLDLGYNRLKVIPDEIATLSHLVHLELEGNRIKKLPVKLWTLTALETLNLARNRLGVRSACQCCSVQLFHPPPLCLLLWLP